MNTAYTYQVALIVPDAQVEAARRIAQAMGWGPGNYSAQLLDGSNNVYWGLSSVGTQSFVDMLSNASSIELGEDGDQSQFDSDIAEVMPVLLQSIEPTGSRSQGAQFEALCQENSLTRVTSEAEA